MDNKRIVRKNRAKSKYLYKKSKDSVQLSKKCYNGVRSVKGACEMAEKNVSIKYDSSGIFIHFNPAEFEILYEELSQTLKNSNGFFQGSSFRGVEGFDLDLFQKQRIEELLSDYGIDVLEDIELIEDRSKEAIIDFGRGLPLGPSKLFAQTIRSGQFITYEGSIILLGDLNAGGEIKAEGNVIVFGTIRGRIHAGCGGNRNAFVMGYKFESARIFIAEEIFEEAVDYQEKQMIKLQIEQDTIVKKLL